MTSGRMTEEPLYRSEGSETRWAVAVPSPSAKGLQAGQASCHWHLGLAQRTMPWNVVLATTAAGGYLKGAGKRRLASQSAQAENTMGEKATNSVWLPVGPLLLVGDSWGQLDPRPKGGAERNPSILGAKPSIAQGRDSVYKAQQGSSPNLSSFRLRKGSDTNICLWCGLG